MRFPVQRLQLLFAALAVSGIALAASPVSRRARPVLPAPRLALAPGDPAPAVRGDTIEGKAFTADWSEHRVTVVNFWAVWCEPCKGELPILERLHREKRAVGLGVLGLEIGRERAETSRSFLAEAGVTYPVVSATEETVARWGGVGIYPTTFLVDGEGRIRRKFVGATPSEIAALLEDVDLLLAGKPLATRVPSSDPPASLPDR